MITENRPEGIFMETQLDDIAMTNNSFNYVEAVQRQWPTPEDPMEQRIIAEIGKSFLTTQWARDTFDALRGIQLDYIKDSVAHLQEPIHVYDNTQEVLANLAEAAHVEVVEGKENIDSLPKGKGVLIATNHVGSYKLISLTPEQLEEMGIGAPVLPVYYPFPLYFASMWPIAERLGDNLHEASFEYPGKLGEIYRASGSIEVPPIKPAEIVNGVEVKNEGRTETLVESTKRLLSEHPNAAIVSFPEGGTTGKRNGKGPYDMEPFRSGSFIIAAEVGIPILPVAQYFNQDRGFELKVFKPVFPSAPTGDREVDLKHFSEIAHQTSSQFQEWLNARQQATVVSIT